MLGLATDVRNARLETLRTKIDAGGSAATLCLYSGARPYTGGKGEGMKLAELKLSHPCSKDIEDGLLIFSPISECHATAAGKASWGRITASNGKFVLDCSAGEGDGDLRLKTSSLYEGMRVDVIRLSIEEGNE
jgi:hypothetical protein